MNFIPYADRPALAQGLADTVAAQLRAAIAQQGRATLCVAGGTTPAPMFDILAQASLDWSKVTILPTDERWVDETDTRSNAALVKRHLMVGPARAARYVSFFAAGVAPQAGIAAIAPQLAPHLPLNVVVAGMGADWHTASLFPDAPQIAAAMAADAPALMVMQPPSQPEARITLTAPVLGAAQHKHIMITGAEKRAVFERIGTRSGAAAPVTVLLDTGHVHWAE
jgi:6-phosphogluconolactonase